MNALPNNQSLSTAAQPHQQFHLITPSPYHSNASPYHSKLLCGQWAADSMRHEKDCWTEPGAQKPRWQQDIKDLVNRGTTGANGWQKLMFKSHRGTVQTVTEHVRTVGGPIPFHSLCSCQAEATGTVINKHGRSTFSSAWDYVEITNFFKWRGQESNT